MPELAIDSGGGGGLPSWALPVGLAAGAAVLFFVVRGAQGGGGGQAAAPAGSVQLGQLQTELLDLRGYQGKLAKDIEDAQAAGNTTLGAQLAGIQGLLSYQGEHQYGALSFQLEDLMRALANWSQYNASGGRLPPYNPPPAGQTDHPSGGEQTAIGAQTASKGSPLAGQLVGKSGQVTLSVIRQMAA